MVFVLLAFLSQLNLTTCTYHFSIQGKSVLYLLQEGVRTAPLQCGPGWRDKLCRCIHLVHWKVPCCHDYWDDWILHHADLY